MANSLDKIKNIDFKQTILQPLEACIDAHYQATMQAQNHLMTHMFQRRPNGDYAPVEMTFEFSNQQGHHVLHVPMLCLTPIPSLQIQDISFSYIASVTHYEKNNITVNYRRTPLEETTQAETAIKGEMKVKLTAETADRPMGIAQLLELLDNHYPASGNHENLTYFPIATPEKPVVEPVTPDPDEPHVVTKEQKEAIANLLTSLQTGGHLLQNILNNLLQTAGTNASPNDKAIVDIVLKSAGGTIINVVRELHESLGISLIEAKKLVDNAPTTIMTGAAKDAAEALKAALVALGAEVELR